jgi:polyisoprenoid-binding protein YceI
MKHAALLLRAPLLAALSTTALPAASEPVTYALDPQHSFVHFELTHFGTSTIRGRLGPVTGEVTLDRSARRGEIGLRLPTASVNTGLAVFDSRIRAADLLATQEFPEAFFVASTLRFDGDALAELRGEFTLRGVGQALSLRALRFSCRPEGQGADATEVCGGDFEGSLLRSDFGITFGLPFISDAVRVLVQVEGRRR